MASVIRIGLNAHAVGASKSIEVVDIERTQINLQGFEHVGHRHAQLACLRAIKIGIKLRHIDLVARVETGQLGCLIGLGEKRLGRIVQRLEAKPVAILKLELETACCAETLNGRWREHGDESILNGAELLVQFSRDCIGRKFRGFTFFERLQRHENDAGVRRVGETIDRQTGEGDGIGHARMLEGNVAHAADHIFRTVERCRIRQLREADQILLVLRRNEAAGHCAEQHEGDAEQHDIEAHHQRLARENAANAAPIGV
ncbi:hypothetical protein D3C80_284150 [compost metagenome]